MYQHFQRIGITTIKLIRDSINYGISKSTGVTTVKFNKYYILWKTGIATIALFKNTTIQLLKRLKSQLLLESQLFLSSED